jgi:(+)-trans-carveol dehydrogenase
MGRVEGKVAFVTGAARGQGRSHAARLAEEGADVVLVDICRPIRGLPYEMPTSGDLKETARLVESHGRRALSVEADVRSLDDLRAAVDRGVSEFGVIDIVSANAGIVSYGGTAAELSSELWQDMIDINLTGVWHTAKASIPQMIAGGRGGSIIVTSSAAGLQAYTGLAHYVAAKHGVIGLMRTLALELAEHMIRVNAVLPTQVDTPMFMTDAAKQLFVPGVAEPSDEQFAAASQSMNVLPIPWVEAVDITNAVLFLASDESRYITGAALPVDAGTLVK